MTTTDTGPTWRHARGDIPFALINYGGFLLFALVCGYPFYYLIINSISANDISALGDVRLLPTGIHFENYSQMLGLPGLTSAAMVSIARTVIGTGATVLASDTPPVREMIRNGVNGVLFDFFNVDALAELMSQLLDRRDEYRVLGQQGSAIIRDRYSVDVCLPKMVELYESVRRT